MKSETAFAEKHPYVRITVQTTTEDELERFKSATLSGDLTLKAGKIDVLAGQIVVELVLPGLEKEATDTLGTYSDGSAKPPEPEPAPKPEPAPVPLAHPGGPNRPPTAGWSHRGS